MRKYLNQSLKKIVFHVFEKLLRENLEKHLKKRFFKPATLTQKPR